MSEISTPNPESQPALRQARLKAVALIAALGAATAGGGYAGYELLGESSAQEDQAAHRDQANLDTGCIDALGRLAIPGENPPVIRLSRLTSDERADCGVNWINPQFDNTVDSSESALHGSLAAPVRVRLPSASSLRANRQQELTAVANVSDTVDKGAGIFFGGFFALAGSLFGVDKMLSAAEKRRKRKAVHETEEPEAA